MVSPPPVDSAPDKPAETDKPTEPETVEPDRGPRAARPAPSAAQRWRPLLLRWHFYAGILIGPFLLVAAVTGIALGVVMGMSRIVARVADIWIAALYPLPKISLIPLLIIWLGTGEAYRIVISAITALGGIPSVSSGMNEDCAAAINAGLGVAVRAGGLGGGAGGVGASAFKAPGMPASAMFADPGEFWACATAVVTSCADAAVVTAVVSGAAPAVETAATNPAGTRPDNAITVLRRAVELVGLL